MPADRPYTDVEHAAAAKALLHYYGHDVDWLPPAARAVLDAAAPLIAARVTEPWRKRAEALEALLACYRTGRQPSEALHRRLEKTRTAIAATTTEGTDHA